MTDMNKVGEELKEHWNVDVAAFTHTGTFKQTLRDGTDTGGRELTFTDSEGFEFFAEVNSDSEVWNWDLVPERK